jgi:hypothetical protein
MTLPHVPALGRVKRPTPRPIRLILYILPLLPIALLAILIVRFSVNVPFGDEWRAVAEVYVRVHESNISFDYLISQHNESRKLFPRLLWIALSAVHTGDHRFHLVFAFFLACVISWMIYRLARGTLENGSTSLLVLIALANVLIFSPNQYDNWLWGIQFVVFAPMACLLAGILVCRSACAVSSKFLWCALLSTVSTFTYANGMMCWILLLLPLYGETSSASGRRDIWLTTYLSAMFVNLFVYFWDYEKPVRHPSMAEAMAHPLAVLEYFLVFLGNALGCDINGHGLLVALVVGLTLLVWLAILGAYLVRNMRQEGLLRRAFPWLLIVAYVIFSAAITAVGRVGRGMEGALASRYVTFAVYLPVSLIFLTQIVTADAIARANRWKSLITGTQVVAATILVVLAGLGFSESLGLMGQYRQKMLGYRAAIAMMDVLPNETYLFNATQGYPDTVISRAPFLIEEGYVNIPMLKTRDLSGEAARGPKSEKAEGKIESVEKDRNGLWFLKGWAWLPSENEPPSAIIFSYSSPAGKPIAFDYTIGPYLNRGVPESHGKAGQRAENRHDRADPRTRENVASRAEYVLSTDWLAALTKNRVACAWKYYVNTQYLPKGPLEISAWAFDSVTGRVIPLGSAVSMQNGP